MATPARAGPNPAVPVIYPGCDGEPMADNTEHFAFINTVQGNLEALLPDFVAGDRLWYPVEGRPDTRVAPAAYEMVPVNVEGGFVSPRLGIRFGVKEGRLQTFRPDGKPFRTYRELAAERDAATAERAGAAAERDALMARLKALGIDPDAT